MTIDILKDEHWWGGLTDLGSEMPMDEDSNIKITMAPIDQGAFLFVSDKGRYIYSPQKHNIEFSKGKISIDTDDNVYLESGFSTLKAAHKALVERFFSLNENIPDELFFRVPQFNTWMALGYNQTEEGILEYAQSIIDNGFKPGIFMIDEGWSEDYGVYDFYPGRFGNPKAMIDKLHKMGFKVMLWVTPNISPDSNAFRELKELGYLTKNAENKIAVREWWNGYSCVLDLTNPKANKWFVDKLQACLDKYNADGFKFDAGDYYFYRDDDKTYENLTDNEMASVYNDLGEIFPYHEYRTAWNLRGKPILCRMQDKEHTWGDKGIKDIIPNTIVQGIIGCLYSCPDMVGGGALSSASGKYDTELYIRWAEANTYCSMMQFSVAPWCVLSENECDMIRRLADTHTKIGDIIMELAKNASKTGEPIVRCMEYEFPNQGFETVTDQFMLGDSILVAPVLEKGVLTRMVKLPHGEWYDNYGIKYRGGTIAEVSAPPGSVPVFTKEYKN